MTERPCSRCGQPLTLEEGHLSYCGVCGAPQIFLAEEVRERAAEQARLLAERTAAGAAEQLPGPETRPRWLQGMRGRPGQPWPAAVETAFFSGAITLGFSLASLVIGPLLALDWLWVISAPMLTVGFFNTRFYGSGRQGGPAADPEGFPQPVGRLSPGFAARLGLLTGLFVIFGCALAFTPGLLLSRFAFHHHALDADLAAAFAQVRSATEAQYGEAAAPVVQLLGIPEFRVGFLLWIAAVSSVLYLLLATATAGFAGLLLSRRRAT